MAISYVGSKTPQTEFEPVIHGVIAEARTLNKNLVNISEAHKDGADVYESKVDVGLEAYSSAAISSDSNTISVNKTEVYLSKIMAKGIVDYNVLLGSRFEKSMQKGAFNTISNDFDRKVMIHVSPSIGAKLDYQVWNGVTAATKTAVAGLTPGAGQGSITAAAQTAVSALTATQFDGLIPRILYNNSQSKDTPGAGLGDYVKVTGTTVTASNIADEYAKIFNAIDSDDLQTGNIKIFAPDGDYQLILTANNVKGAATNTNFVVEGSGLDANVTYNGVKIEFVKIDGEFRVAADPMNLHILMDLKSDMTKLEIDKMANGADQYYYKNVMAVSTWCTDQKGIVLYGG